MCGLISTTLLVNNGVHEYFNNPRLVSGFSFARQPDAGYQLSDSQQNFIDENDQSCKLIVPGCGNFLNMLICIPATLNVPVSG